MRTISRKKSRASGFTLIELLVVVSIVGVLSALAVVNYQAYRMRAKVARTAAELRSFGIAFQAYELSEGMYPADTNNLLPPGMENYIVPEAFHRDTPLGGRYNWEGPSFYPYAGISISSPTVEIELIQALDRFLDDGNLAVGRFRIETNGRPTYIIEEMS
ncbi:MAG: type II secretion system protein [Deltaproteobacteria bacterium]|nr:type II secretion system protein [Deltaproteobacteria bacterium]